MKKITLQDFNKLERQHHPLSRQAQKGLLGGNADQFFGIISDSDNGCDDFGLLADENANMFEPNFDQLQSPIMPDMASLNRQNSNAFSGWAPGYRPPELDYLYNNSNVPGYVYYNGIRYKVIGYYIYSYEWLLYGEPYIIPDPSDLYEYRSGDPYWNGPYQSYWPYFDWGYTGLPDPRKQWEERYGIDGSHWNKPDKYTEAGYGTYGTSPYGDFDIYGGYGLYGLYGLYGSYGYGSYGYGPYGTSKYGYSYGTETGGEEGNSEWEEGGGGDDGNTGEQEGNENPGLSGGGDSDTGSTDLLTHPEEINTEAKLYIPPRETELSDYHPSEENAQQKEVSACSPTTHMLILNQKTGREFNATEMMTIMQEEYDNNRKLRRTIRQKYNMSNFNVFEAVTTPGEKGGGIPFELAEAALKRAYELNGLDWEEVSDEDGNYDMFKAVENGHAAQVHIYLGNNMYHDMALTEIQIRKGTPSYGGEPSSFTGTYIDPETGRKETCVFNRKRTKVYVRSGLRKVVQ